MIWPFKSKPTEIVLGRGLTLIGHGVKNGRAFIVLRPVKIAGKIGTTPPEFEGLDLINITARRGDVVLWLDGLPFGLLEACKKACEMRVRNGSL